MTSASASPGYTHLVAAARAQPPVAAIVLGSGLASVAARLTVVARVPFLEVPELPTTSVLGHPGRLTLGDWAGRRVLVFEGRLHYYEGHPWRHVTATVHTAAFLGARRLLLTNAAGGIRDDLQPGSLMAIQSHLDWTRPAAWRRQSAESPYSPCVLALLREAARERGIELHEGSYAALTGPNYETPSEIRALRVCGADAVGMSTVREAEAAQDCGLECAAISCITNRAAGLCEGHIHHGEVLTTAAAAGTRLAELLEAFLERLA